jgi:hypothetical protein
MRIFLFSLALSLAACGSQQSTPQQSPQYPQSPEYPQSPQYPQQSPEYPQQSPEYPQSPQHPHGPHAPPPSTPGTGGCMKTGCGGTVCAEREVVTTCEFRPEHACYRNALCERQPNGRCAFTQTPALTSCLANPPPAY